VSEILIASSVGFVVGAGVVLALVRWAVKHPSAATHGRATNEEYRGWL